MSETMQDTTIRVVSSNERGDWDPLVDPPGQIPSGGRDLDVFSSAGGTLTTGFWEREPDTWSFERPYDEVALILEGDAEGVGGHVGDPGEDREVLGDLRRIAPTARSNPSPAAAGASRCTPRSAPGRRSGGGSASVVPGAASTTCSCRGS